MTRSAELFIRDPANAPGWPSRVISRAASGFIVLGVLVSLRLKRFQIFCAVYGGLIIKRIGAETGSDNNAESSNCPQASQKGLIENLKELKCREEGKRSQYHPG